MFEKIMTFISICVGIAVACLMIYCITHAKTKEEKDMVMTTLLLMP